MHMLVVTLVMCVLGGLGYADDLSLSDPSRGSTSSMLNIMFYLIHRRVFLYSSGLAVGTKTCHHLLCMENG